MYMDLLRFYPMGSKRTDCAANWWKNTRMATYFCQLLSHFKPDVGDPSKQ